MKNSILVFVGFIFLVGCGKKPADKPKTAADKAIATLKTATENLKHKSVILDSYPPKIKLKEADIEAVESAIAALEEAIAKKGVSEKTKVSANQAIKEANQSIKIARNNKEEVKQAFMEYYERYHLNDLKNHITDLEAQTEKVKEVYLARATSTSYIEEVISKARDSINNVRGHVAIAKADAKDAGEEIKALVNQTVEKANQAIAAADQAIKNLLTL